MTYELSKLLEHISIDWAQTGSRYICNPPPTDTDDDYVLLINPYREEAILGTLEDQDFILTTGDGYPEPMFITFRKGEINLIVTKSDVFYQRFLAATELAKARNLLSKDVRISLFQMVLYGES